MFSYIIYHNSNLILSAPNFINELFQHIHRIKDSYNFMFYPSNHPQKHPYFITLYLYHIL